MMNDTYYFTTTSGTTIEIQPTYSGHASNRDAVQNSFMVSTSTGPPRNIDVIFPLPPIMRDALQTEAGISFEDNRDDIAVLTVLSEIDRSPEIFEKGKERHEILADSRLVLGNLKRSKLSDREMRRYLVRKVYDHYSRTTLGDPVVITKMDFWITGAEYIDFVRNIQVLAQETYLDILKMDSDDSISIRGKAKLVREFERFGAARDDVVADHDYEASLRNYDVIGDHEGALILEHRRYSTATTPVELISVFRAVAPTIENILRSLLREHGSRRQFSSLSPMIQEMQKRNLGSVGLWSQLNHILRFSRDLTEHGVDVSEPVLRISCENAFELVPQLASLFPKR